MGSIILGAVSLTVVISLSRFLGACLFLLENLPQKIAEAFYERLSLHTGGMQVRRYDERNAVRHRKRPARLWGEA